MVKVGWKSETPSTSILYKTLKKTPHNEKMTFVTQLYKYFNLIRLSKNQQPVITLYLSDGYTRDSLGLYSSEHGVDV